MTKIIWMSDPHYQESGTIDGLDPRARLNAAVAYINAHHDDADFAVLSGDLVGDEIEGDYTGIARELAKSTVTIYPLMGNNDERAGFLDHLKLPKTTMPDFVQYVIDASDKTFICLDTHKVGSAAGQFCKARQEWLEATLSQSPQVPTYIFMHHPPVALGLPPQDEIMLEDHAAFLEIIGRHPQVRHLFMGHVHRPTSGTVNGIPFATIGAISFQAPAPRPQRDWKSFKPPQEAPQLGVLLIEEDSVVLQYTQFCDYGVGVEA